jgi:predicted PurR-regulated permease PerM
MDPHSILETAHFLSSGSISAVIGILIFIIIGLIWERIRLVKKLDKVTEKVIQAKADEIESIREIIDLYHQGNLNLIQTLAEIKGVLTHMQSNRIR